MMGDMGGHGDRSLGEAANRWVTWQIVMSLIGLALFVTFFAFFFLPMWHAMPVVP
jgi:hypothetical protein